MIVHQVFAQIYQEEVKNIVVCDSYEMANWLARATYGENALAVDCLQYPCVQGDKYRNGIFYHTDLDTKKEMIIEYVPTQEQQVQDLKAENEDLTVAVADVIGGVYNA